MRSGWLNVFLGFTRQTDFYGRYWTKSGAENNYTYFLDLDPVDTYSSRGPDPRYYGFSLRCLQK